MDKENFFIKSQLLSDLQRAVTLINTGVFNAYVLQPFQESVFVLLTITLNDLLQKLDKLGHRVDFTEDVPQNDITDLVNKIRNAICHLDSGENIVDKERQTKFVFNVLVGRVAAVAIGNNTTVGSDYDDDIAFCYGPYKIYLNRHIIRAIDESQKKINLLYPDAIIT